MRVAAISLSWFRGAAETVTLDVDGKSVVVYGQNAAGKSSFVDAVEYAIAGKLGHQTHEYSGRHQEKGIPNTHTPEDAETSFAIRFSEGSELNIRISHAGASARTGAEGVGIQGWEYQRTCLRQDEVANFIRSRKGDKYSALLPLFGLHELEIAAENLRQLGKAIEQQSSLERKHGLHEAALAKRKAAFGEQNLAAIEPQVGELHKTYCPTSTTADPPSRCVELEAAITTRINEITGENQRYLALRTLVDAGLASTISAVREANTKFAQAVEPLIAEKLEVLQAAGSFADGLSEGEEVTIKCPACGQTLPLSQFKDHLTTERERLREISEVYDARKAAIGLVVDVLKALKRTLAGSALKSWREKLEGEVEAAVEWVTNCDPETYRQALNEEDAKLIERHGGEVIAAADKDSQSAPPEMKDLSKAKTTVEAAKAVFEAESLALEIARIEKLISFVNKLEAETRSEIRERTTGVIGEISQDIRDMWDILHPGEPIGDIHLYVPDDKAIDVALKFHGKEQESPRLTLSEGYRNSLGLCIFLALAKREAAKDRPLFLDDVVVSLDRDHRGMIFGLLERLFRDRQIIVFTHDRDWFAELRRQLDEKRWKFKTLMPYETPLVGIRWSDRPAGFDDARTMLKDRPDQAGNHARKIMDIELSVIAEKLQLRLPYRRGDNNDKRMWSDFLDQLRSDGKKCLQKEDGSGFACDSEGLSRLEEAGRLLMTWGNTGSHSFNLVKSEAEKLINACEAALGVFECSSCCKPLYSTGNDKWVQCRCGGLRWRCDKG
ncbi:AAA family ATPase [Methyloceanibacter sp.]|uniref:AAA family ATPase n=1 Tax=Methyloceanibacter sp. TaxID=1965321 RepID=UPI002C11D383|nr:AAA family ATPase [Methyloceanibacter sp.]HML92943.1 AAA family ATPase [Methyloceanibacter sp.]